MAKQPLHHGKPGSDAAFSLPLLSSPGADSAVIRTSRSAPRRAIVLLAVQFLIIAHIIHWKVTGESIGPVEPSEAMETIRHGVINAGTVFFVLALLSTLVLGRWFCGWGCHVVLLQDFCGSLLRRAGIHPRPFRSRLLLYIPLLLALYMFVWPVVYRWGLVPLSARLHDSLAWLPALDPVGHWQGFSLELSETEFWSTFPGWMVAVPFLGICGFACVYFLGNKGYCTYGCPYGGFFAPLEQYAPGRIRVSDDCEQCGHCTAVCTSNVRVHDEVREYGMVVDPGCMKCLDCVSVCPNDALSFGFGKPAVMKGAPKTKAPSVTYDVSRGGEILLALVFAVAFYAAHGSYNLVPMLMASGVGICVVFLAWKSCQILREENANLHRFRMKFKGRMQRSGCVFLLASALVFGLVLQGTFVRGLVQSAGRDARLVVDGTVLRSGSMTRQDQLEALKSLVFSTTPLVLSPVESRRARRGLSRLARADSIGHGGIGLFRSPQTWVDRAWLHSCLHEWTEAITWMKAASDHFGPLDERMRDIGLLYRMEGDGDAIRSWHRSVLDAHPEYMATLDGFLQWFQQQGEPLQARDTCLGMLPRVAAGSAAELYLLRRLSLYEVELGRLDKAIEYFQRTIDIDDSNPASYVLLARTWAMKGEEETAVATMQQALDRAPGAPGIMLEMAQLLEGYGRSDEARAWRERAAEQGGDDGPVIPSNR